MPKKKKRPSPDDYDWDEMPDMNDVPEAGDQFQVHLRDYVIEEKVRAFARAYRPCREFDPGAEAFDDARLRLLFKAQVCGLGDPLSIYVDMLKDEGYQMEISLATGEPCIFAVRQPAPEC